MIEAINCRDKPAFVCWKRRLRSSLRVTTMTGMLVILPTAQVMAAEATADDLFSGKAPALSVGALSLQNYLSVRPEVREIRIQHPFVFAAPDGAVMWISSWSGTTGGGRTYGDRCRGILQTLRTMIGSDGSGQISPDLRMTLNAVSLSSLGLPASDALASKLASIMKVKGNVHFSDGQSGTCEGPVLTQEVIQFPGAEDARWAQTYP